MHRSRQIVIPARRYTSPESATITCDPGRTALLLIDCDGHQRPKYFDEVKRQAIAPVLQIARRVGIRPVYLFQSAYGTGGPADVTRNLAGVKNLPNDWQPALPVYDPPIAPLPGEPQLPKCQYDGFNGSHADYYLRTWGIDTILAVGFSLECCVYQTCLGARCRNYHVILLRDCTSPPLASEDHASLAPANPEAGWVRWVFLRMYEKLIGATSTSAEFLAACSAADGPALS